MSSVERSHPQQKSKAGDYIIQGRSNLFFSTTSTMSKFAKTPLSLLLPNWPKWCKMKQYLASHIASYTKR